MTNTTRTRAAVALFSAMLIWGFSFLAIKDVVAVVPVSSLLFLRFALAAVLLGAVAGARGLLRLPKRDLAVLAGLTLLSPVGYFLFETYGVAYTQPSHVSILIATIPIAVYLIALVRGQERWGSRKAIGIAVAYGGILLIVGSSQQEAGASLLGDLLVLGAVLCAAFRTSLVKDVLRRVLPIQLTFYQFLFSLVVFAPLAAADGTGWIANLTAIHGLEILFLGVFCSAIAFLAMHYALAHLSVTQVAVSANIVPIITLLAEIAILGVALSPAKGIGTAITIAGVAFIQIQGVSRGHPRGGEPR